MPQQRPSVGRVVHYRAHGSPNGQHKPEARAALITEVISDELVGLAVLNPSGMYFDRNVKFDETGKTPGCWFWPPFVPPMPAVKSEVEK